MSGLATYNVAYRVTSADVGYAVLQAGKQGYLTDSGVAGAGTNAAIQNLINTAVVSPGGESFSQRNSIVRAIQEGLALGDLSDARVATATTVQSLAELTWVTLDPAYLTGHLGPNLLP